MNTKWKSLCAILVVGGLASSGLLAEGTDKVLAKVNGQAVTEAEILEALAGELLKLDQQRHDLIERAVTGRVQEILAAEEAKSRELSPEALLEAEVNAKIAELPAEEVDAFYNARRAQIRQPKEQVEPQIRRFLAYQKFMSALEAKAEIEVLTEPFRVPVAAVGPSKGKEGAAITIVEFGDFECPPCRAAYPVVQRLREAYPEDVRVVFRQFPLAMHANARKAGEAALCANDQGKFWELHDKMFDNQKSLSVDDLKTLASQVDGIDGDSFAQCLDGGQHAGAVEADFREGSRAGVSGTPSFFVNGRYINGVPTYEGFVEIVEDELARHKGAAAGS